MKIKIPFCEKIKHKIEHKYLKRLDYKLFYEAYKKYVLDVNTSVPDFIEFKNVKNPKVSIIISLYNQFEYTMKCLYSVKNNTKLADYEIILIDDCSSDETINIDKYLKNVVVIRNKENIGYLKSNNIAVSLARGQYIYLLNNDTFLLDRAIDNLVYILDNNLECGAVGSKLIYPDGRLQSAGSYIKSGGHVYSYGHLEVPIDNKYNILREVDYCCGASLMIRKFLWKQLNGFDELFAPAYFEETDFCLRLKQLGYKIFYCPKSEVIHYSNLSYSENSILLMEKNKQKFKNKWKHYLKKCT